MRSVFNHIYYFKRPNQPSNKERHTFASVSTSQAIPKSRERKQGKDDKQVKTLLIVQ